MKFMTKLHLLFTVLGSFCCSEVIRTTNFEGISIEADEIINTDEVIVVPALKDKKNKFSHEMEALIFQYNMELDDQNKRIIVNNLNRKRNQFLSDCDRSDAIVKLNRDDICCYHIPKAACSIVCGVPLLGLCCACIPIAACVDCCTCGDSPIHFNFSCFDDGFNRAIFNGEKAMAIIEKDMRKSAVIER